MSSTFSEMKSGIETGWDEVIWSESYGVFDAAALIGCVAFGCALQYLGARLQSLAEKIGMDVLETILKNKGQVFWGPGDLEVEAGDAYWSEYIKVWNPIKQRHEKITTNRFVRLYVRFRRKATNTTASIDLSEPKVRIQALNRYCGVLGYEAALPNFHQAVYPNIGEVYGTFLLKPDYVEWADILAADLGNPNPNDVGERFRSVGRWAAQHGFSAAFPNFEQADYGDGTVYGTFLLKDNAVEWRDISAAELGDPNGGDIGARFRAVNDWCGRNGLPGGFPNFEQGASGNGTVYGTFIFKREAIDWRDIRVLDVVNFLQHHA